VDFKDDQKIINAYGRCGSHWRLVAFNELEDEGSRALEFLHKRTDVDRQISPI
jgi:hypothetical protein